MEILQSFYETYISTPLLLLIVLSGLFITKYTKGLLISIKNSYKVLIVSILFSLGFYFFGECKTECIQQYIITYLFATSFYELLAKWLATRTEDAIGKLSDKLKK